MKRIFAPVLLLFVLLGLSFAQSTTLISPGQASIDGILVGHGGGTQGNSLAVGQNVLTQNTTGNYNTGVGVAVLSDNITGIDNTGVGADALKKNRSSYNTAVGVAALYEQLTGHSNTAIGRASLQLSADGTYNTAIGYAALQAQTTGSYNTAVGRVACGLNPGADRLVCLGHAAGRYEQGSNAFYVDAYDRGSTSADKNGALLYGTFNTTPSSQTLNLNAKIYAQYLTTMTAPMDYVCFDPTTNQIVRKATACN